jgi:iron complex outermembrane recepter protein
MQRNPINQFVSLCFFTLFPCLVQPFAEGFKIVPADSVDAKDTSVSIETQSARTVQKKTLLASTDSIPVVPLLHHNEIIVFGTPQSLTSPSLAQAAKLKRQVPGGLTIAENDRPEAENFKDLQKYAPGVFTQSDGGMEESRISIRGSGIQAEYEPLGLELLLDGIPYNEADGKATLEDFDLSCIHYSETYRGANAFKYGSSTLGGAMNLVPLTGYTGAPINVDFETGTYGTVNADASLSDVRGPYDYYVSATSRYRNNGRRHSREDIERFFGNFGYRRNNTTENRVYLSAVNLNRQVPGELTPEEIEANPLQANPEFVGQNIGRTYRSLRLADKLTVQKGSKRFDFGGVWRYRDLQDRSFYSEESRAGISASGSHNAGVTLNLVNESKVLGFKNVFTIGGGGTYERERSVHFKNVGGQRGDSIALYVTQAENVPLYTEAQQYFGKRFSVLAGVQGIYAGRQFENKFRTTQTEEEEEEEGEDENELDFFGCNPKLGLMYEAGDAVQFFANTNRSWQPPSFSHLLGLEGEEEEEEEVADSESSVGFAKLRPQSAWSTEIGCRGDLKSVAWELALYRSWVRDELLAINDVHGNTLGTMNIPRSIHQGIEAGLSVDLLRAFSVQCGKIDKNDCLTLSQCYTFNDFHFENDSVYHDNRLGGLPVHVYHAGLKYERSSGFYCGPELDCILSRFPADQANTLYADPYAALNFSMGFMYKKGLSGYLEIKNLLNKHYSVGVEPIPDARTGDEGSRVFEPGLGRAFYCGLQWKW